MNGASGAALKLSGDTVIKTCKGAKQQVRWFQHANQIGLPEGLSVPQIYRAEELYYEMEYIQGHEATHEATLYGIKACLKWCLHCVHKPSKAEGSWDSYLVRLEDHVKLADTAPMRLALQKVSQLKPLPPSFNHGDLTLENVLITPGSVVLIDPNYDPSLFQSYILDLGKVLQSTHFNYHKVFDSNHGVNLKRHGKWIEAKLKANSLWEQSLLSCLSHIIRLRKYQPIEKQSAVDFHLASFINSYT